MNVNSRGHNLDTRFEQLFPEIKHQPGVNNPVGDISPFIHLATLYAAARVIVSSGPKLCSAGGLRILE